MGVTKKTKGLLLVSIWPFSSDKAVVNIPFHLLHSKFQKDERETLAI